MRFKILVMSSFLLCSCLSNIDYYSSRQVKSVDFEEALLNDWLMQDSQGLIVFESSRSNTAETKLVNRILNNLSLSSLMDQDALGKYQKKRDRLLSANLPGLNSAWKQL